MYFGGAYFAQTYFSGFVGTGSVVVVVPPTPPSQGGRYRPRTPDIFNSKQANARVGSEEEPKIEVVHVQPNELVPVAVFKLTESKGADVLADAGGEAVFERPSPVVTVRLQRPKKARIISITTYGDSPDDMEAIWAVLTMLADGDL